MRISTIQAFNTGVRGMQDNYSALARTQEQVSSGKRILTPADDPVASVRLLQLGQEAGKLAQYKANMTAATNSLTQEEAILTSVTNVLQRIREIALEAGNGALDEAGRKALAQELAEREEELFGLMNSQNARGEYLFGGFQSDQPPFVKDASGNYHYNGDEGERTIQIGGAKTIALNDNGKSLFVDVANADRFSASAMDHADGDSPDNTRILSVIQGLPISGEDFSSASVKIEITEGGAGFKVTDEATDPVTELKTGLLEGPAEDGSYTLRYADTVVKLEGEPAAGDSFTLTRTETRGVLDTVALLRDTLENTDDSDEGKAQRSAVLATSIQNIDNAMDAVMGVHTSLGARLNVIESTQLENDEASLINTTVQSGLEDLDYAEALSRLTMQSIVLEAAQQSFVKISTLSLFNLLR